MVESIKKGLRTALCALGMTAAVGMCTLAFAEGTPTFLLEAGEPDENGIVTLNVSAENIDVLVYELGIRYNKEALEPYTKSGTISFNGFSDQGLGEGMSYIGQKLDAEKGCFIFTGFVAPGSESGYADGKQFHIADKTLLYTFRFKALSDKDYGFEIASVYDGGVYDESFPDGAVVLDIDKLYPADVCIRYPGAEKNQQSAAVSYSQTHPKNFTKEDRLKKTVYLMNKDYAAVTDGALKAIDPDNHAVTPYEADGTRFYPLRFVCENLGRKVGWDEAASAASVNDADGSAVIFDTVNGTASRGEETLEGKTELKEDRTMVSESLLTSLGFKVYDGGSFVIVYDSLVEWDPERDAEKDALSAMQYVLMPFFRAFI